MNKYRKRAGLVNTAAGADASMDVLATLFVSFVLLFALAVLLSGGNKLLAKEQYVMVEILLRKNDHTNSSPPSGEFPAEDMKPYPMRRAPLVELAWQENGTFMKGRTVAMPQKVSLENQFRAYSKQKNRYLNATATAHEIEFNCGGRQDDCRKYVVIISQLARGTYRLEVSRGLFKYFDKYSVTIDVIHPYQTETIRQELNNVSGNWEAAPIDFTFNPKVGW
ncbi:hypothetical protein M0C34_15975 [Agarivorans sp. TSD2052]|uniref:hypothetical protein n=1 Tax=Agarivorans sp. TSD2052 TaxID=2937286 RepID=UPI00201073BE|nr:hypothetical protein [Agarivorans sp. TSD2052]UPW17726.1 hypothetical protein M0C34_15975 [Agarivorans sp. TSD2052]